MALERGARLGPYEIVTLLGAGGMGEVYRARDRRIGRDVALKVLSVVDRERVRRFQQEARAAGRLNHPGVVAVYDVGEDDGRPYVVSELLEGRTLRELLRDGALPPAQAIGLALQVAHALAAAHDLQIVHRDLKPENLFVKHDGTLKILDFGIAKLGIDATDETALAGAGTVSMGTSTGMILGTAGYMAPEQVRGEHVDARADVFALGAILHEMLSGHAAFGGDTAVERMHAVLKEEPRARQPAADEPTGLAAVLERCLAKHPRDRFDSGRAVALALAGLLDSSDGPAPLLPPAPPARTRPSRGVLAAGGVAAAILTFVAGARFASREPSPIATPAPSAATMSAPTAAKAPPLWRQLTFGNGVVPSARFAPDGRTVLYGAAWHGRPVEVFTTRVESASSRALGLPDADVLAVSSAGEMALSRHRRFYWWPAEGTLARVPVVGGAPRDLLDGVQDADWSADGETMAVSRSVGGKFRIEYPIDTVLYETEGWVSRVRVSPDGKLVAFFDHPFRNDDMGDVAVVDLERKKTTLSTGWMSEQGLAWSPRGDEVWFSAASPESAYAIHAVDLRGNRRLVMRGPSKLLLHDVSREGRALVAHERVRAVAMAKGRSNAGEIDVSSADLSVVTAIARDGGSVLISEQSSSGGKGYDVYLRRLDDTPGVRLGVGLGTDLSPDGKSTLTLPFGSTDRAIVTPTGAGEARSLSHPGLQYHAATFFPDGARVAVLGEDGAKKSRWYEQPLAGGAPRPITVDAAWGNDGAVSPDGKYMACRDVESLWVVPIAGGEGRRVAPLAATERLAGWTDDSRSVHVLRRGEHPAPIERVDVTTGKRTPWKLIAPADPSGFVEVSVAVVAPDGKSYAYTFLRVLSTLYVVEGLE